MRFGGTCQESKGPFPLPSAIRARFVPRDPFAWPAASLQRSGLPDPFPPTGTPPIVAGVLLLQSLSCPNGETLVFLGDFEGCGLRFLVFKMRRQLARFPRAQVPVGGVIQQDGHTRIPPGEA
jgi:hypothetical protein